MVDGEKRSSQKSTPSKSTRKTYDRAKRKRNVDLPTVSSTHNQFITPDKLNEGYAQMMTNTPPNNLMMSMINQLGNTYVPLTTQDFTTLAGQTDHFTCEQQMENIMAMQNAILTNYCFGMWMYYNQQMNSNGINAFPNQSNICQHNQSVNFPSSNNRQTRNVSQYKNVDNKYTIPLELGWTRQVGIHSIINKNITGTVTYISPEGQRFLNMSDIDVLLLTGNDLSRENFSFDQNLILGEFFDNQNPATPLTETELRSKIDYAREPQMVSNSQGIPSTDPHVNDCNLMDYLNQIQMSMNYPQFNQAENPIVNTPKKRVDPIEPKKSNESANSSTKKCPVKIETPQKDIKTNLANKKLVKTEDLLIKSSKPLFGLRKRCYEGIDHKTFENCLMAVEFSYAFADFIKIDSADLVSIADFISFFYGNSDSLNRIVTTFMALLRPLLPLDTTTRYYKSTSSTLKYYGKHCIVTNNNCSELFAYLLSLGDQTDPHIAKMRDKLASHWLFSLQSDEIGWAFAYMVEKLVISTKFADIIDKTFEDITKLKRAQSKKDKQMKFENSISTEKPKVISSDEHSNPSVDSTSSSKKMETVQRVRRPSKLYKNIDTKTEVAKLQRRIRCPLIGHDRFYRGYYIMHYSKAIFVRGVTEVENKGSHELIPEEYKTCWFSIDDLNDLKSFNQSINHLGCRESFLERGMHKLYASIYALLPSKFDPQELPVKPVESFDFSRYPYYELWKWMEDFKTSVIDWFINRTEVSGEEYNLLDSDNEATLLRKCKNYIINIKSSIDTKILRSPFQNENEAIDFEVDKQWRNKVERAQSCSNLAIFAELLKDSITWDKIYNKMVCQICQEGEKDHLILICDSCNHGFHSYCIKPPLDCIPVGDWFCPQCISNSNIENGKNCCFVCGKDKEQLIKCTTCTKNVHVDCISNKMTRFSLTKWQCKECEVKTNMDSVSSSRSKSKRQRRSSFVLDKDVIDYCTQVITKLEEYEEAEAFLTPVDCRRVHQYKKVIEFPMDFSTVMKKLKSSKYASTEDFANDVRLIFDNCEKFNEDLSEIGQCGYFMRNQFEEIWSSGPYCKNN